MYSTALNIATAARCHTNANMISELRAHADVPHVYIGRNAVIFMQRILMILMILMDPAALCSPVSIVLVEVRRHYS